jgi:hypothetical protein
MTTYTPKFICPEGWRLVPIEPTDDMILCMAEQKSNMDKWYGALACSPCHPCTDLGDGRLVQS